ncbi:hypothetical protein [Cryobacterium sp. Hh38]|uniref:hypothetical protein n=1 Tax=Cryobacterium sp. Hh38 TaxID=1259156 RepID=UPI00106B73E3|nr:hypothetical protein [Cryobacterium sp. Hh38]TFD56392.1 hypothetical protein E3T41_14365 [Cryobacterium sp. Hh38]
MADKEYKLHYAGTTFEINHESWDVLTDWDGVEPKLVELHLTEDHWLTISLAPGVAMAVEVTPRPQMQSFS